MRKSKKIQKDKHRQQKKEEEVLKIIKNIQIKYEHFTQVYEDVNITDCILQPSRQLNTKKLTKVLETKYGISFINKEMRFYLQEGSIWLLCPKLMSLIPFQDYHPNSQIKLQILASRDYIDAIMEQSDSEKDSEPVSQIDDNQDAMKCRRLKERKIKQVIDKVLKWRELYAGVGENAIEGQKVSLEDGAKLVNISKKTLDDYLSQIKKGKKYGFNFNQHKNEKVGVLRQFIRKAQKSQKK